MAYNITENYNKLKGYLFKKPEVMTMKSSSVFFPGRIYYIERIVETKHRYNTQMFLLAISQDMKSGNVKGVDLCKLLLPARIKFLQILIDAYYADLEKELGRDGSLEVDDMFYLKNFNEKSTYTLFSKLFNIDKAIKTLNIKSMSYVADVNWGNVYKIIDLCDKSLIANGNIAQYQIL